MGWDVGVETRFTIRDETRFVVTSDSLPTGRVTVNTEAPLPHDTNLSLGFSVQICKTRTVTFR